MATQLRRVTLDEVVRVAEGWLGHEGFVDYEGARNGLQVENEGHVTCLGAAVDGSLATVRKAAGAGVDLLLVHHGLFWGRTVPWTGGRYRLMKELIERGVAVFSSHLPLDAHPRFGNNVLLARALGMRKLTPFFTHKGRALGWQGRMELGRDELAGRLLSATDGGRVHVIPAGPERCRRIGVVTGGAGGDLAVAAAEGVDTFVTGEGPHWTHALAEELGVNVLYGGHYATETFGVKALAAALGRKFRIPWVWVDHPTGL